ncbi:phenol degradation protein meta [Paraburkholderia panacisoli]|uniref:Phenol degradation protein meta n=1 Tax=Paraburkholderia panacisoli TaxID=2603818 RepID=A0A5B0GN31_9BURK|nr:transporter [Paraburkholderia panacisoli]KAA1004883.1 phenol degradation protein meta [Paraburkholderia panacisoli]
MKQTKLGVLAECKQHAACECVGPRIRTQRFAGAMRRMLGVGLLACGLCGATSAVATEGGGTSYPLGVNTVLSGFMPPPGLYGYAYLSNYDAAHTLDNNGNDKAGLSNFDLHVQAASLRVDYVYSGIKILGADVESRFALPYINGSVEFNVATPKGSVHKADHESGFGDLTLSPFLLGWHGTRLNQIAGFDVFVPTGDYNKTNLFNPGRNYWAFGPWYAFTLFLGGNWEMNGKAIYIFNGRNHATDYTSGQEFNLDYDIAYNITPAWQVGVNGYAYKQTTDDKQGGNTVAVDGNKGQVVAIGPFFKFQPNKTWGVVVKWQHETLVRNRARGDRIWLQAAVKF